MNPTNEESMKDDPMVKLAELAFRQVQPPEPAPDGAGKCPHCHSGLLWSEDRGAHCDGCDDYEATPPAAAGDGKKSAHKRVFEYDGAFKCLDCEAEWGALPGNPGMPEKCAASHPQQAGETPRRTVEQWRQAWSHSTGQTHPACGELYLIAAALEAEATGLREALGGSTPWPVEDVLDRLATAAEHLINDHQCDEDRWEEVHTCAALARNFARLIRQSLPPSPCDSQKM